MARRSFTTKLPAPWLTRVWLRDDHTVPRDRYPMTLPWLADGEFEMTFDQPVTILVGENGVGKSTLVEAIAAACGFDEAGGGQGYRPVDHSAAIDTSGAELREALRLSWLPKVTRGWFFKAESFFAVARYLDAADSPSADFLSHSHGEGFVRFFDERMRDQGIYFLDEPESALSPKRQIELLRFLSEIQETARAQVIMATHSPFLMAVPGAAVMQVTHRGLAPVHYRDTDHFRLWQEFTEDPEGFVAHAVAQD